MAVPAFRELLVVSSCIFHMLALSFILAFPASLSPALLSNSTDIRATKDEVTWINASNSFTGIIGFLTISPLMQIYGRKFVNFLMNAIVIVGWLIMYFATNVPTIVFGRSFQGVAFGGLYINSIIIAEYCHPKRRGSYILAKVVAVSVGILFSHILIRHVTWRQMCITACVPAGLALIITFFWIESPAWLAYKGRYEESAESFRRLRGDNKESRRECEELIAAQQQRHKFTQDETIKARLYASIKSLRSKEFLRSFIIVALLVTLAEAAGLQYYVVYIVDIMKQLTADENMAYFFTLGGDVISTLSTLTSCLVVKLFTRRSLLFASGLVSSSLVALMCVLLLLHSRNIVSVSWWLAPSILLSYRFVVGIGILPLSTVLIGEIIPLEFRGIGSCLAGIIDSILCMVILKWTPFMLDSIGVHGTFLVYLVICSLCLISLYFMLPETKDKTLQEIQVNLNDKNISSLDVECEVFKVSNSTSGHEHEI